VLVQLARDSSIVCTFCLNRGFIDELKKFKNYHELVLADRDSRLAKMVGQVRDLEADREDMQGKLAEISLRFEREKHSLQGRVAALEIDSCCKTVLESRVKQLEANADLSNQHMQLQEKKFKILSDELYQVKRQSATRKKDLYEAYALLKAAVEKNMNLDKRNRTCDNLIKTLRQQMLKVSLSYQTEKETS
jgi:hypothetical protein